MRNIYDAFINKAQEQILNSSDRELFADNFENRVYEKTRIETPYLDKAKTSVSIDKEVIGFHNAPPNVSFTPGQTMEFALFKVPIVGDLDLFATIVRGQFYDRSKKYVEGRTLIYKELSHRQITGNDTVIEEIKAQAKQAIDSIQNALDEFRKSADSFNENELKKFISSTIQRERDRRNDQSNSENKLNPFG